MDKIDILIMLIAVVAVVLVIWSMSRIPVCSCNQPGCGGGCNTVRRH